MEKHIVFIAEIRFKMVGTMLESKKHEEIGNNNEGTVDVEVVNIKSEVPHDHQPSLDNQVSSTFYRFAGSVHLELCTYIGRIHVIFGWIYPPDRYRAVYKLK